MIAGESSGLVAGRRRQGDRAVRNYRADDEVERVVEGDLITASGGGHLEIRQVAARDGHPEQLVGGEALDTRVVANGAAAARGGIGLGKLDERRATRRRLGGVLQLGLRPIEPREL